MKKELITTFIATGAMTAFFTTTDNASATSTYTVKAGDSLAKIAAAHNTTTTKLKKLNHLNGLYIYVGQKLNVTGSTANQTATSHKTPNSSSTYTVRSGDSLSIIATKNIIDNQLFKDYMHTTLMVIGSLPYSAFRSCESPTLTASHFAALVHGA